MNRQAALEAWRARKAAGKRINKLIFRLEQIVELCARDDLDGLRPIHQMASAALAAAVKERRDGEKPSPSGV